MFRIFNFFHNITNKQAIIVVFMMACFLAINSLIILNHNKFYSYLDEDVVSIIDMSTSFVHEYNIIEYIKNKSFYEIFNLIETYWKPPAFFIFSLPFLIFIKNINVFISILNLIISFITLVSVYGITKRVFSIKAGLLASYILTFIPLFFVIHRTFFIEILLTAMIALVIDVIFFNRFNDFKTNMFLSVILIIAILTKEQVFIYFPIFLIFAVFSKGNYKTLSNIVNIGIVFLFSFLVSYLLWYYLNAPNIFKHLLKYSKETFNTDYLYYLKSFYYFDISSIISFLFIAACIFLIFKKKYIHFVISFFFIIVIFSLSGNKVSRHIFPVIIFCPIIISLFIFNIRHRYVKNILISIILLLLPVQYFMINYLPYRYYFVNHSYNFFRGVTFYDYKPMIQTYKQQYEHLTKILGYNFEEKTAFIQVFSPIAYNFLLLQQNRKSNVCKVFIYDDIPYIRENITNYTNIIISDRDKNIFDSFEEFLLTNSFEKKAKINIYNHDNNEIWLYTIGTNNRN